MDHISPARRLIPEFNLRLVNKEALEVVDRPSKGLEKFRRVRQRFGSDHSPVLLDSKEDMMFLVDGSMCPHYLGLPARLTRIEIGLPSGYLDAFRHLALRVVDFAKWPDLSGRRGHPSGHDPLEYMLWFRPGFPELLRCSPQLETMRIVIDRLCSNPIASEHRAVAQRFPSPVRSPSQLKDLVASMPRDRYGFSDYDAFATATKCPNPNHKYDPFFQKVLDVARKHVASYRMFKNSTDLDLRLVVDLNSNLNERHARQFSRRKKRAPWE